MIDDLNRYLKRTTAIGFTTGIILVSIIFVGISFFVWGRSQERQIQPWLEIFPQNVLSHLVDSDYHPISGKIRLIQKTKLFDSFAIYDYNKEWIDGFGIDTKNELKLDTAIPIKDESGNTWGWYIYQKDSTEKYIYLKLIFVSTAMLIFLVVIFIQFFFNRFVAVKIARFSDFIDSIDVISNRIKSQPNYEISKNDLDLTNPLEFREALLLQASIVNLITEIQTAKSKQLESVVELEKNRLLSEIATQVAHDIRSPLEVMKSLIDEISGLPDTVKRRVQLSVNRIEEITFNLLRSHKKDVGILKQAESEELLSLLLSVVAEKRIEYKSFSHVEIEGCFEFECYGSFSLLERSVIMSVLSNLVNNSVESFNGQDCRITISLKSELTSNIISVVDNGIGIRRDVLRNLFTKGFTTKKTGNGLGLYNAKNEIEAIGGSISCESELGKGTTFTIKLPKSEAPKTFINHIDLYSYEKIIILDDDSVFHEIWNKRFEGFESKIEHVYSVGEMLSKYKGLNVSTLLLSDFELMDKDSDGIDTIIKLNHCAHSVLVTARSDDMLIQERCLKSGIKLLSKSLVNYIKVIKEELVNAEVSKSLHISDKGAPVVLIDNDRLILLNWANHCEKNKIQFCGFNSIDAFINASGTLDRNSRIYVDSNLGEGIKGEVDSEKIYNLGFFNLYLATGYDEEAINKPHWIKGIHSKSPKHI